jgi:hypothetical protein
MNAEVAYRDLLLLDLLENFWQLHSWFLNRSNARCGGVCANAARRRAF